MATIDYLLNKIINPELRAKLQSEIDRIHKQKRFGLVFEDHLPEATLLYDVEVRRGQKVTLKTDPLKQKFEVLNISNGIARCISLDETEEQTEINVADLVSYDNLQGGTDGYSFGVNELIPYADFGDPIYPYLQPLDKIKNAPDATLWHEVIEADNYHALQLLAYLYPGQVDCIYIDPPYNTGARDWKYNNDYVDSNDSYRHSKWLSMMRKRLILAKKLLNPQDSVLIVTIDEKEYNHLGCLLEELFSGAYIQMISSVINPSGSSRKGYFSRSDEYIYYIFIGNAKIQKNNNDMLRPPAIKKVRWHGLLRGGATGKRKARPNLFYPIFFHVKDGRYHSIGNSLTIDQNPDEIEIPDGCFMVLPISSRGEEATWEIQPATFIEKLNKGYIKFGKWKSGQTKRSISHLQEGTMVAVEKGEVEVFGKDAEGTLILGNSLKPITPMTTWVQQSHSAGDMGTTLLTKFLSNRPFPFPKSLYAVHDTLRFFVANKPSALIVDFFAGSGTTLHAVNLLNAEDGGNRRCIMVTNNEVSEAEERNLKAKGKTPADEEWKALGIARYVTWPRTVASVSGTDVNGKPIAGEYLTYLENEKETARKFKKITFLKDFNNLTLSERKDIVSELSKGKIAKNKVTDDSKYIVDEDTDVAILLDDTAAADWLDELESADHVRTFIIITQNNRLFTSLKSQITEMLGNYNATEPKTLPMSEGFKANVEFFHLGFLDKNAIALNRQFKEILPLLWLKAGGIGERPSLEGESLSPYVIFTKNRFAVLIEEYAYCSFAKELSMSENIDTLFIITNSTPGYQEMIGALKPKCGYQLYRDYLDNFRINYIQ